MKDELKTYTIENKKIRITVLNYGSRLVEFSIKLEEGYWNNVVLSYDHIEEYLNDELYMNALVGPSAGRIKNGRFMIDDKTVEMIHNEGSNNLHSGPLGLSEHYFLVEILENRITSKARYFLPYQEGYIDFEIHYIIKNSELVIETNAIPSVKTLINPTHHIYFNLNGDSTIENHRLQMDSKHVFALAEDAVPMSLMSVVNTIFDFRYDNLISEHLVNHHPQFKISGNIDHPYKLGKKEIVLTEARIGLELEIQTDRAFAIIYMLNKVSNKTIQLSNGRMIRKHAGIAIEPQSLPNGINFGDLDQIYGKEEPYISVSKYKLNYHKL